ncbi:hypothetical protein ACJ72_01652 [Emergomyces africanus]|uniref:SEC7 domain-containing protein n=1 Tax=Emergomyces africanus TaxID=1955775 RepID=A0A1B7P4P9_9EURO|nr:hypothetical protein ACJ72_01652 [Emergomyces africanus]
MTVALERSNDRDSPDILGPSSSSSTTQDAPTPTMDFYQSANMNGRSTIPIAVNPVELVTTECITITSSMRKHSRWAHSSVAAILGGGTASRAYERELAVPPNISFSAKSPPKIAPTKFGPGGAEGEHALASRWGLRGKKGKSMQDNPLMSAFTRLRIDLKSCKDIRDFDTPALLHPFLQVIRSSSTSAPITSLALVSITKFFAYNIINRDSPRLSMALQLLSAAITHCRFEASDTSADEIVLLRILKLMEGMLSRPEGELLGDESVCEMMETGLSMCCQVRLSEVLRRSAEMSMINMCQVIFQRLSHLDIEDMPDRNSLQEESLREESGNFKMDPSVDGDTVTSQHPSTLGMDTSTPEKGRSSGEEDSEAVVNGDTAANHPTPHEDMSPEVKPYSLPSIRELFRVLIDLLDPHNRQHTDTMRVMSLRIIDVALEVAGPSIARHPSLAQLARDDLCRHLFQLVRFENMTLLNGSLRVAGTLLSTCRSVLKLQQELFLSYLVACLHPRVEIPREPGIDPSLYSGVPQAPKLVKPSPSQASSGRSTPVPVKDRQKLGMEGGSRKPEAREAMVESIGALARIPSFMAELFVNYDCEVDRADLCEDMVGLLCRNAFPDSATWSTTNVPPLCLDALLGYVQFIAERLDQPPNYDNLPDPARLRSQQDPDNPHLVAKFLKGTSRISKKILGEYISKKSNESLLDEFIGLLDFDGKRVDEALRDLLGSFRLPGEAPLITRILTVFSDKYITKVKPTGVADKDSLFVLTYAIIMLNTNLYNRNVKSQDRMSFEGFVKNLRGVNGGNDFDMDFLRDIYTSIQHNEIILPDEHENKHAFEYAWKELLMKTVGAGELAVFDSNVFDAEMFEATWRPVIATLSYVFMSASDDAVFSRVVIGFDQCAKIAARYKLTEALDRIVYCLSCICTLASDIPPNTSLNTEVQAGKKSVMVSELAVKLGRNFRAQLATVVMFRVLTGNEAIVREGWTYIIQILHNLFINSLIPQFESMKPKLDIPPIPLQPPSQVIDRDGRGNESGLLSAFTSYLSSYAADDPPEPSDEELENTLCTVDCISACFIPEVLANISSMPLESTVFLVNTLLSDLPDTSPAVIVVKPERPPPNAPRPPSSKSDPNQPSYDPGMIYILEFATILTLRDQDTIRELGENLTGALQNIVRDFKGFHYLAISRAISYLLNLLRHAYEHSFMRAPVVLHAISAFDQNTLESSATPILKGLSDCITSAAALRSEITKSPDFWSILQRLHRHQEAFSMVFDLLQYIVHFTPPAISADNYEAGVSLANDFASAGSLAAVPDPKRAPAGKRAKALKHPNAQDNPLVQCGVKAIGLIYHLTGRVPDLIQQSHLERNEAWAAYWSPIFNALTTQCLNPCRDIRHQAISALQRSLLSPELASTDHTEWIAIFGEVLFPLILRLLKPEVYQSDPVGMSETRVQAATLVCKIFLHYLVLLSEWDGMLDLWLKILDILDRMMNSGQGDSLEEAVPESLKNILLVMADGGYLAPPAEDPSKEKIWVETQKRLDRFLPRLFAEIFPFKPEEQQPPTSPTPPQPPPQPPTSTTPQPQSQRENEGSHEHPSSNDSSAKADVTDDDNTVD